jgi:tetratricopeptide (TPR) repeat protein
MSVVAAVFAADVAELEQELAVAARAYDVETASRVLAEARVAAADEEGRERVFRLQAEAGLLLAELLRIDFEQAPQSDRALRSQLGQRIDAAAQEALGVLEKLPETSERYRMEADLVATMIRSDFRARKYRGRLETAIDAALELDDTNARAWVSSAKPLVFAEPEQGGDLAEAIRRLDHALELDPGLEPALLLRAVAHEMRGDAEAAAADWRAALRANPECRPARRALEET